MTAWLCSHESKPNFTDLRQKAFGIPFALELMADRETQQSRGAQGTDYGQRHTYSHHSHCFYRLADSYGICILAAQMKNRRSVPLLYWVLQSTLTVFQTTNFLRAAHK
jgi:hypothetical protein